MQNYAKLLLKTTNFCSRVTEHHSAAEVCLCPPSGTNELARPAPSLKVDSWLSWHRNAKVDPFVHQPSSTQNCWTLPELSVSSLLAPRLGLRIFRLRNMWKYNDSIKCNDNSCNCNNNDQIKLRNFCLTTRSFLHISCVPFHKLRHRKKTQHVKKYPQHRSKLLTMNGISSNLSLSCRVAQEGNWPPRIRSCSRQGFISRPSLDAHKANLTNAETIQKCFDLHDALRRKELHFKCGRESEERMHELHRFEQPGQRSKSSVSFQTETCHQHDCFISWKSKKASKKTLYIHEFTCAQAKRCFNSKALINQTPPKKKLQGYHSSLSLGWKVGGPPRIISHQLSIYSRLFARLSQLCKPLARNNCRDRVRKVKQNSIKLNWRKKTDHKETFFSQRVAKSPLAIWLMFPSAWSTIRTIHLCHISTLQRIPKFRVLRSHTRKEGHKIARRFHVRKDIGEVKSAWIATHH